jgi:hypothetical protein
MPTGDFKCEVCCDTGYYGDNGPGIKGNTEYHPCDICQKLPTFAPGIIRVPAPWHMTKRELFAAMAMQGLCANPEGPTNYDGAAEIAVAQADALLAALEWKGE